MLTGPKPLVPEASLVRHASVVQHTWTIKKGAVWWIRGRNREDAAQVILQAVQAPDCLQSR